jgi:hypothetical protein
VVKVLPSSPGVSSAGPAGEKLVISLQCIDYYVNIRLRLLAAAREFVYELSEFLSRRYPETYTVTRRAPQAGDFGWYGDGQIKRILIRPFDVTYDLDEDDPTKAAALL